MGAQKWQHGYQ